MDKGSTVFNFWRELGLSVRAANILINLSCHSLTDVRRVGPDEVLRQHGMGPPTYNEIARLLGWETIDASVRRRRLIHRPKAPPPPTEFKQPSFDTNLDAAVAVVGYLIKRA